MASTLYTEVTSVSTYGYERDRVLDKLQVASTQLPYTVDDITISHNDFAVSDVYNDSIRKIYGNYLNLSILIIVLINLLLLRLILISLQLQLYYQVMK